MSKSGDLPYGGRKRSEQEIIERAKRGLCVIYVPTPDQSARDGSAIRMVLAMALIWGILVVIHEVYG
jgi:hypothetical protein